MTEIANWVGTDTSALALAAVVIFVGALVQGATGFGFSLVAVPFLAVVIPDRLPQVPLIISAPTFVWILLREKRRAVRSEFTILLAGRLLGIVPGVILVQQLSVRSLKFVFAAAIIVASGMILAKSIKPRFTVTNMISAGITSGVMATAASIGGPPIALLYANRTATEIRVGLASIFLIGNVASIIALGAGGEIRLADFRLALLLLVPVAGGTLASGAALKVVDGSRLRILVVAVSLLGAVGLVVETLLNGVT